MIYQRQNFEKSAYMLLRGIRFLSGTKGTFDDFKDALGQRESSNNYSIVNRYGYMGKYQFGSARLNDLYNSYDLPNWRPQSNFINNPELQEQYFYVHVQDLADQLAPLMNTAKQNLGDWITLSGLIGAAHLKGPGGARSYVNGHDNADANGTYTSEYAQMFSGYDIPNYDDSGSIAQSENGSSEQSSGVAHQAVSSGQLITAAALIAAALKFL